MMFAACAVGRWGNMRGCILLKASVVRLLEVRMLRALLVLAVILLAAELASQHGSWVKSQEVTPWVARSGHASVVFDNRMWIVGGSGPSSSNDPAGETWSSPDGETWTLESAAAPWHRRIEHGVVVFDNRMWILGGSTGHMSMNDVWSSPDGVNWSVESSSAPWPPRHRHACVVFDGRLWVMGGIDTTNIFTHLNDVWSSNDGVNWVLQTPSAAWHPRSDLAVVVFGDRLWTLGGVQADDLWSSQDGSNWTLEVSAAPWLRRWNHAAAVFDGRIWITGGQGYDPATHAAGIVTSDVWSSGDGVNWQQMTVAAAWPDRRSHSMLVFKGRMWIVGGHSHNGGTDIYHDDVWSTSTGIGGGYPMRLSMDADHLFTHNQKLLTPGIKLDCRGGTAPYTWFVTGSNLPSALVVGSSTTYQLEISNNGGNVKSGTYGFDIRAVDAAGEFVIQHFTVVVAPASRHSPPPNTDSTTGQNLAAGLAISYFESGGCAAGATKAGPWGALLSLVLMIEAHRIRRRSQVCGSHHGLKRAGTR